MSTLTPNYGLIVPDGTDTVEQVRADYATNLNTIDGIGGGGSGGHTIVNPSGTDMPAEGKLQFTGGVTVTDDSVNGKTVVDISGGGGNVYGAFIDPSQIIASGSYTGTLTYTAIRDCIVVLDIAGDANTATNIQINGVAVNGLYHTTGGTNDITFSVPLKMGQILTVVNGNAWLCAYTVYGLTQGTNGIFTPIIYSDTERVVGVWRDNKPLYQRTWEFGSSVLVSYSSWTNTTVDSSDIENIITVKAKRADGTCFEGIMADPTVSGHTLVGLQTTRNGAEANVKTLTLQYTKISDVAGSGNWNTDGVPTVHYSTTEQVIGTWIDGKPLYGRVLELTQDTNLTANTWVKTEFNQTTMKALIKAVAVIGLSGAVIEALSGGFIDGKIALNSARNVDLNVADSARLIVQYTKTTD